jgi:hypothetical protein
VQLLGIAWMRRRSLAVIFHKLLHSGRSDYSTRPDDTSWNVSKCQAYFDDCLYFHNWKITGRVDNYVPTFYIGPRLAQETRGSGRNGFGPGVESEAIHQRRNLF